MKISKRVILSSVVCLLPLMLSALLYAQLPNEMPIHWNSAGEANNYISKSFGAWGIPVFMLAVHLIVSIKTERDCFQSHRSPITEMICFWIIPFFSVTVIPLSLFKAAGYDFNITQACQPFVGILFVVTGNYMPKSRQNVIAGYKLPWTLADDDNWNKTHRFAGGIWVICGIALIIISFIPLNKFQMKLCILLLAIALLSPIFYSVFLHKTGKSLRG